MTEYSSNPRRGWWNMPCFNGLSEAQQKRVVEVGNLEIGYQPEGKCQRGAEVEITTVWDKFPGPRFYCLFCAAEHLTLMDRRMERRKTLDLMENRDAD